MPTHVHPTVEWESRPMPPEDKRRLLDILFRPAADVTSSEVTE